MPLDPIEADETECRSRRRNAVDDKMRRWTFAGRNSTRRR